VAHKIDSAGSPAQAHDEAFLQVLAHRTMLKAYILAIVGCGPLRWRSSRTAQWKARFG
jgi:hypothetical protein